MKGVAELTAAISGKLRRFPLATVTQLVNHRCHSILPCFLCSTAAVRPGTSFLILRACLLARFWLAALHKVDPSILSLCSFTDIHAIGEESIHRTKKSTLFPRLYLDDGLQYLSLVSGGQQDKA